MPSKILNIKCYLEGVEIPIEAAQISIAVNQVSTCSISIPPTNQGFKIRPRTRVHLFWLDDATGEWLLIWEGEVLSLGFSKDGNSRSLQLSCMDMSNYWDYTFKMMWSMGTGFKTTPEIMFYGNTSAYIQVPAQGEAVQEGVWRKIMKGQNLPDAIISFLNDLTKEIPYYNAINSRSRINDQLRLVDDKHVQKLLVGSSLSALTSNLSGGNGDMATIRDLMNTFISLIGYTFCSIGAPSWRAYNNTLGSFYLTPNTYGCLPPRCNVVFPDTCSRINYSRSFMQEPTRVWARGQVIPQGPQNTLSAANCGAPAYLYKFLTKKRKTIDRSSLFSAITDEELEKGIVPSNISIPFAELFSISPKSGSANTKYMQQYVDYMFQLSRYAGRTLSFSTPLNPFFACNFPCVVFDASRSYFAQIASISHSISASGGGYTSVECNLAREVDVKNDDSPFIVDSWFCENYQPDKIHLTYSDVLGCQALGSLDDVNLLESPSDPSKVGSGAAYQAVDHDKSTETNWVYPKKLNMSKVAARVYNPSDPDNSQYHAEFRANSSYAFADTYSRRRLANMKEVFRFYNITDTGSYPPEEFDTDMHSYPMELDGLTNVNGKTVVLSGLYKRDIVRDYVKEIKTSRVLDGR